MTGDLTTTGHQPGDHHTMTGHPTDTAPGTTHTDIQDTTPQSLTGHTIADITTHTAGTTPASMTGHTEPPEPTSAHWVTPPPPTSEAEVVYRACWSPI